MNTIFLVYFEQLPKAISDLATGDKNITISKDGLKPYGGSMFPRISIRIKNISPSEDKDRNSKVKNLLQSLKDSGQIIGF